MDKLKKILCKIGIHDLIEEYILPVKSRQHDNNWMLYTKRVCKKCGIVKMKYKKCDPVYFRV